MLLPKHIKLLQELIQCQSVTPIDAGALPLLDEYLATLNFKSQFKTFGDNNESVLNLYSELVKQGNNKHLCFAGHTDVVPPGDVECWTKGPFAGEIKDGILYGRGAVDMKGAIVAFIAAVEHYLTLQKPFGTISFLLTGDEEAAAKYGTEPMIVWLYDNNITIDHCIIGEPVSKETVGDNIKIGARGSATFHLQVQGIQGHVAYQHLTDNPVKKINAILNSLFEYNFIHSNLIFDKTNVEITKIYCDSGAENMVPNSVNMRFNFRYCDGYNHQSLHEIVENIILQHVNHPDYHLQSSSSGDAALWVNNLHSSYIVNLTKDSINNIIGCIPEIGTYGGTSDARFIRRYCDVVEVGLLGTTAHKIDENVSIEDLEKLTTIYLELLSCYFLDT